MLANVTRHQGRRKRGKKEKEKEEPGAQQSLIELRTQVNHLPPAAYIDDFPDPERCCGGGGGGR